MLREPIAGLLGRTLTIAPNLRHNRHGRNILDPRHRVDFRQSIAELFVPKKLYRSICVPDRDRLDGNSVRQLLLPVREGLRSGLYSVTTYKQPQAHADQSDKLWILHQ